MYDYFVKTVCILLYWIATTTIVTATASPNYRVFSEHENYDYEYGYINLKAYEEKKLNMTPFNTTTTSSREDRALNCFMSTERQCQSVNIKEIQVDEEYECQLLDFDRHKCYPHFVDDANFTYYDIDTKCSEPMPCPNEKYWCIPDHIKGDYSCVCKHDHEGDYCQQKREKTHSLTAIAPTNEKKAAVLSKEIPSQPARAFSVSLWFLNPGPNFNKLFLLNIAFPPLICHAARIKMMDKSTTIAANQETGTTSKVLARSAWANIVINIDIENGKTDIYQNGEILKSLKSPYDTDVGSHIEITLGQGKQIKPDGTCSYIGGNFIMVGTSFKEVYAWERLLDKNDVREIYQNKFIPHNPFITWNDFKEQQHMMAANFNESIDL